MKLRIALLCLLGAASAHALACYTVYDRSNRVVYQDELPPVDMRLPIHDTLPRLFPGGHLVFDVGGACPNPPPANKANVVSMRREPPGSSSPLLTDRATAEMLGAPHRNLGNQVAVVPADVAARMNVPTFSVIPADTTALAAAAPTTTGVDTRVLGAGPAPGYAPASPPVARAPSREPMLTIPERRYPSWR